MSCCHLCAIDLISVVSLRLQCQPLLNYLLVEPRLALLHDRLSGAQNERGQRLQGLQVQRGGPSGQPVSGEGLRRHVASSCGRRLSQQTAIAEKARS